MTVVEFIKSPSSTNPKSPQNLNSFETSTTTGSSSENLNKINTDKDAWKKNKIDNTILNITEYLVLLEENPVKNFEKAETISLGMIHKTFVILFKKYL